MSVDLPDGGGLALEGESEFGVASLPEPPRESPITAVDGTGDVESETDATNDGETSGGREQRRLTLTLSTGGCLPGPLTIGGDVLNGDYGTSLDSFSLPPLTIGPPRFSITGVKLGRTAEGLPLLSVTVRSTDPSRVKGSVEGRFDPGIAGVGPMALPPIGISLRDALVLEWELEGATINEDETYGELALVLHTRKYGDLSDGTKGGSAACRVVDCSLTPPAADEPAPSPGDTVNIFATVRNPGAGRLSATARLTLEVRDAAVADGDAPYGAKSPEGTAPDSKVDTLTLEPAEVTVGPGDEEEVRWSWTLPEDIVPGPSHAEGLVVSASVTLVRGTHDAGEGDTPVPDGDRLSSTSPDLIRVVPPVLPRIDSVTSPQVRCSPGSELPLQIAVSNAGRENRVDATVHVKAWAHAAGVHMGDGSPAGHGGARAFFNGSKPVEMGRRSTGTTFNVAVPEDLSGVLGGAGRISLEVSVTSGEGPAVRRQYPDFATLSGMSVLRTSVIPYHPLGGRPSGGAVPPRITPYILPGEEEVEDVTVGGLTVHRLNSNTFLYTLDGRVVDSLEWRASKRPLTPFYGALFRYVLGRGKYDRKRLRKMAAALDVRGVLIGGLCHRLLTPGGGDRPPGGVVVVLGGDGEGDKTAGRKFSPRRWKEWCLGTAVKGGRLSGAVTRPAKTVGLDSKVLAQKAPPLSFLSEVLESAGPLKGKPGADATPLWEIDRAFSRARAGLRKARLKPVTSTLESLSTFLGEGPGTGAEERTGLDVTLDSLGLRGPAAVRGAAAATCLKAGFMARTSGRLESLAGGGGEPFNDLLEMLRFEFYVHVLDLVTERLLDAAGEHRGDLTPQLLLTGTSAFAPLQRDSRKIFREFMRRARGYVSNMSRRNALAALRGKVTCEPADRLQEFTPGQEVATVLRLTNPYRASLEVTPALVLPHDGISLVEPESNFTFGLHMLAPQVLGPGSRREVRLSFFVPGGEQQRDMTVTALLMPAGGAMKAELGASGTTGADRDEEEGPGNGGQKGTAQGGR